MREEWDVRRRIRSDRGEGPVGYLAALLLCVVVACAFVLSGIGGQVVGTIGAGICKVVRSGGLVRHCAPPPQPSPGTGTSPVPGQPARDPDLPTQPCTAHIDSHYLEETLTIPTKRVDVRTNSRGTIQLIKRVGPDGKPYWEVVDFTWGEGGVSTPGDKFNLWGGGTITNGKIYGGFRNEAEARKFFEQLKNHRIGDALKFALRTNPLTSGFVWLGKKLPWVGDDFDRFMGGSEPDRKPRAGYVDKGLTGGFRLDIDLWRFRIPLKGRGWAVNGTQTDYTNGNRTTYYTRRGEVEGAVTIDVGDIIQKLPAPLRQRAQQGLEDALDVVLNIIEGRIRTKAGDDFALLPGQRAQMKAAIKLNPRIGFNYKYRGGTTWAVTEDKHGNILRVTQVKNGQHILYARADGRTQADNSDGDRFQGTAGKQWILWAQRTITEKNLDYSSAADRKIIDAYLRTGDTDAVERAWAAGAGTMGRMVFDNTGDTTKLEGKGSPKPGAKSKRRWGVFELGEEHEIHTLTSAQYFKPGVGWVDWKTCR